MSFNIQDSIVFGDSKSKIVKPSFSTGYIGAKTGGNVKLSYVEIESEDADQKTANALLKEAEYITWGQDIRFDNGTVSPVNNIYPQLVLERQGLTGENSVIQRVADMIIGKGVNLSIDGNNIMACDIKESDDKDLHQFVTTFGLNKIGKLNTAIRNLYNFSFVPAHIIRTINTELANKSKSFVSCVGYKATSQARLQLPQLTAKGYDSSFVFFHKNWGYQKVKVRSNSSCPVKSDSTFSNQVTSFERHITDSKKYGNHIYYLPLHDKFNLSHTVKLIAIEALDEYPCPIHDAEIYTNRSWAAYHLSVADRQIASRGLHIQGYFTIYRTEFISDLSILGQKQEIGNDEDGKGILRKETEKLKLVLKGSFNSANVMILPGAASEQNPHGTWKWTPIETGKGNERFNEIYSRSAEAKLESHNILVPEMIGMKSANDGFSDGGKLLQYKTEKQDSFYTIYRTAFVEFLSDMYNEYVLPISKKEVEFSFVPDYAKISETVKANLKVGEGSTLDIESDNIDVVLKIAKRLDGLGIQTDFSQVEN